MAPRKDLRPTLTIKSERFSQDFRLLINKAARLEGKTQAEWVADTLTDAAQRVVKRDAANASNNPPSNPVPAVATEVYREMLMSALKPLTERLEAIERRQINRGWRRWFSGR